MSPPIKPADVVDLGRLAPSLRALLVSDGTVTKYLEGYFNEPIQTRVLCHCEVLAPRIPALKVEKSGRVLHRRVTCCGVRTGTVYCHALSYVQTDLLWPGVGDELLNGTMGIGELLRERRIETYREILSYEMATADELAPDLGVTREEPLVSRTYQIFVNRMPCFHIIDKFPLSRFP